MCAQLNLGVLEPEQMRDSQLGLPVCRSILTCFRLPLMSAESHVLASWSDSLGFPWQHARFLLAVAYL